MHIAAMSAISTPGAIVIVYFLISERRPWTHSLLVGNTFSSIDHVTPNMRQRHTIFSLDTS